MNKRFINLIILSLGIVLLLSSMAHARTEYAVKESRNCPYCHTVDGPPQLNEIGVYYATNNHSLEGYVPSPEATPSPEPTEKIEIGVHMDIWNVGMIAFATILLMLILVYAIRL